MVYNCCLKSWGSIPESLCFEDSRVAVWILVEAPSGMKYSWQEAGSSGTLSCTDYSPLNIIVRINIHINSVQCSNVGNVLPIEDCGSVSEEKQLRATLKTNGQFTGATSRIICCEVAKLHKSSNILIITRISIATARWKMRHTLWQYELYNCCKIWEESEACSFLILELKDDLYNSLDVRS